MKLALLQKINRSWKQVLVLVVGIAIFLYCTLVSVYWKRFDIFNFLVSLLGVLLILLSFNINFMKSITKKMPKLVQHIVKLCFVCIALSLILVQSKIIYTMNSTPESEADYIIVLGCQVVGEYASLPLLQRGYTAIRYLNKNPQTKAVLTGGQGPGEHITEAEALKRLLLENNIDKERIFLEDRSRSTFENLQFANDLYDLQDKRILVVTSDYHIFRALSVAKKLQYANASGLPSKSRRIVLPAFLLREYASVLYYKIAGRI